MKTETQVTFLTQSNAKITLAIGDEFIYTDHGTYYDEGIEREDKAICIGRVSMILETQFHWTFVKLLYKNCEQCELLNHKEGDSCGGIMFAFADKEIVQLNPRVEEWNGDVPDNSRQAWAWTKHIAKLNQSWHPDDRVETVQAHPPSFFMLPCQWSDGEPENLRLWQECMNSCFDLFPDVYFAGMLAEEAYEHGRWFEDGESDNFDHLVKLNRAVQYYEPQ